MKKWLFLFLYALLFILAYYQKTELLAWIEEAHDHLIPLMLVISTVLALFPVIPFTLFAGVMGAKYGIFTGGVINWVGSVLASIVMFYSFRYFLFNQYQRKEWGTFFLSRLFQKIENQPFLFVLLGRLTFFLPPPLINLYAARVGMKFFIFSLATGLAEIPVIFAITYFGDQVFEQLF